MELNALIFPAPVSSYSAESLKGSIIWIPKVKDLKGNKKEVKKKKGNNKEIEFTLYREGVVKLNPRKPNFSQI